MASLLAAFQPVLPAGAEEEKQRTGGSFYAGAHVGLMFGTATATLNDPIGSAVAGGTNPYGALFGGVQGGWEYVTPSRLMLGIELDFSFPNYEDASKVLSYRATSSGYVSEEYEWLATLRGRVGYDFGRFTPYLTGGIAWASTRFSRIDLTTGNEDGNPSNIRLGYALGAGIDYRLDPRWSVRAEYLYTKLGWTGFTFASAPSRYDAQYDLQRIRFGMNYRFGQPEEDDKKADDRGPGTFEVHGQSVFVYQGYPPIRALYDGPNSLPAVGQSRETWGTSAFIGVRLWKGGELYYNPELLQGYGVGLSAGAGGFPNGEAQRAFPYPRYNTSRLYLSQTFGLGGEREKVESDQMQLSGERDIARISLHAGKYAVQDFFDNNAYANDPRVDFLNWSIWGAGAFDYPADSVGFSWGLTAELNQPSWAVRAGYFLVANQPDTNVYDIDIINRSGVVGELELRYQPFDRKGTTRLGLWATRAWAGSYSDAVALIAQNPGLNANGTIPFTRQPRTKWGFYVSVDQELADDIGAFARFSWNDGRSEILAFTDIDTSLSAGLSIKGSYWGRPDDTVGIAGALNGVSPGHASFLANGGLGLTAGDGALTYATEVVAEAYYSLQLAKGVLATADYQFIGNPAYNAVRGPAHFFSGRLMVKF
jgi:high affinity Mn2+ porin